MMAMAAARVAVVVNPHVRIPASSNGVPVIPPMLAPSMAVDMALPCNRSNHGAKVLPTIAFGPEDGVHSHGDIPGIAEMAMRLGVALPAAQQVFRPAVFLHGRYGGSCQEINPILYFYF